MTEGTLANRFNFQSTSIAGLMVVQRRPIEDQRGFFSRFFSADEFREAGFGKSIAQISHTFTRNKGTVRGLHFQYPPHAEVKVVSCLKGEVFDVAVDIRRSSPTFLHWHGEILSADNQKSLLIPDGFAHGFQTLEDNCEMLYFHTAEYKPSAEGAINVQDPVLAISWPQQITEVSERDRVHLMLSHDFMGIKL